MRLNVDWKGTPLQLHFQRLIVEPAQVSSAVQLPLAAESRYVPDPATARAGVSESAGWPVSGSFPTTEYV